GAAFTLVTKRDTKFSDAIEKLIGQSVEWLNGDLSALPPAVESEEREKPRKGRERGRDRGNSHKVDTRKDDTARETNAAERGNDSVKAERHNDTRPSQPVRNQRPANDDNRDRRSRYRRDEDDGPTPIGFGDDIPAFMLIAGKA
ncbi:MAG TPA: ATP-dependent helicase, partial [Mycoplana sp.]|nr:ATP-dependent helicase [Mycoplana sp.]